MYIIIFQVFVLTIPFTPQTHIHTPKLAAVARPPEGGFQCSALTNAGKELNLQLYDRVHISCNYCQVFV